LPLEPSEDIEVGIWNPTLRTFTVLTDTAKTPSDERRKANAVHVTGRRIKARDNPIPLIFATVVGVFSSDIEREAIAYVTGGADNKAAITPTSAVSGTKFAPTGSIDVTMPANGKYVFSSWTANNGTTTITAPADIYINGDFKMAGTGTLKIVAAGTNKVRFFVN